MTSRKLAYVALWIAITVALGYLLANVPNIELVTSAVFLGGVVFGPALGTLVGALAEFLYSLTSPFGIAAPPLLVAQLIGMGVAGLVGGLMGGAFFRRGNPVARHFLCGLVGLLLAALFDLLTTASFLVFSGLSLEKLAVSFFFGLGFYLAHVFWNAAVFATVVPVLGRKLPTILTDFQ